MTDLHSEAQFDNFFALFEQPLQFDVSQSHLDQRLRALQKRYHPDNVSQDMSDSVQDMSDSVQAKYDSEQASAMINKAYQTLRSPDTRAAYLLDTAGQAASVETSIADLDFLDDAMDMRIALDEAINTHNLSALHVLRPQIASRLETQADKFNTAYEQQQWLTAVDATQKLKFLVKLDADLISAIDDASKGSESDDDDLYV